MIKRSKGRVLLAASHSKIENLGLIYLGGLARDEDWERKYTHVKNHNFAGFFEDVKDFKPDVVGFNIYTGAHLQLFDALDRLRKDHPNVKVAIGGPHATYFPEDTIQHADFVVMSEGFGSFRKILRRESNPGIMELESIESFPHPDRVGYYRDSPEHALSLIMSIIGMTGCPYACSYCYNSTKKQRISIPSHLRSANYGTIELPVIDFELDLEKKEKKYKHGMGGRLFPLNVRDPKSVLKEAREIAEKWPAKTIYFQDDVFGFRTDEGSLLELMVEEWNRQVGIPFHFQMRWEMASGPEGLKRLEMIKEAGASGGTFAIESAYTVIRNEMLDRKMPEEIMFEGIKRLMDLGLTCRTEQISALPYGATSIETPMNLEADIGLLELNDKLKQSVGDPIRVWKEMMFWLSTLAPYKKTGIGDYCAKYGHYNGDNNDVPDAFFERSVLRFPKEWIGPNLESRKNDLGIWLPESELEKYRDQNAELRAHANTFGAIPEGHILAKEYLTSSGEFTYKKLGSYVGKHISNLANREDRVGNLARIMLKQEKGIRQIIDSYSQHPELKQLNEDLRDLAPYFSALPQGESAVRNTIEYALRNNLQKLERNVLSNAVRHHLYEYQLYKVKGDHSRIEERERYPAKI